MLARSQDYEKFLHISGLHGFQNNGVHFHFMSAWKYHDLLVKDKVAVDDGIKIRLTRLATTSSLPMRRLSWCFSHHYYTAFKLLLK